MPFRISLILFLSYFLHLLDISAYFDASLSLSEYIGSVEKILAEGEFRESLSGIEA